MDTDVSTFFVYMPLNDNVNDNVLSSNDSGPEINQSSTINTSSLLGAEVSSFFPLPTLNELNPDAKLFKPSNLTWNVIGDNDSYSFLQSLESLRLSTLASEIVVPSTLPPPPPPPPRINADAHIFNSGHISCRIDTMGKM